jgi:hypothetical protein
MILDDFKEAVKGCSCSVFSNAQKSTAYNFGLASCLVIGFIKCLRFIIRTNAKPAAHYTQCLPTRKKIEHHQPFDFIDYFAQAYIPCRPTVGSF